MKKSPKPLFPNTEPWFETPIDTDRAAVSLKHAEEVCPEFKAAMEKGRAEAAAARARFKQTQSRANPGKTVERSNPPRTTKPKNHPSQ